MKERPILFSTEMVKARSYICDVVVGVPYEMIEDDLKPIKCPYGEVGDRLWVKETFTRAFPNDTIVYKASCNAVYKWEPSIFMPRIASRILLEITDVRVERLQDITINDAMNEGVEHMTFGGWKDYRGILESFASPILSFYTLWESINGPNSCGANPWVWVISFKRIEP